MLFYWHGTLKAGPAKDRPWDPPGFLNADSSAQRAKTYRKKRGGAAAAAHRTSDQVQQQERHGQNITRKG